MKYSSFSMSNVSFATEIQTECFSVAKNIPALGSKIQLNQYRNGTMNTGSETPGGFFFTGDG